MTQNDSQDILPAGEINYIETRQKKTYPDLKSTVIIFFVFILYSFLLAIPVAILTTVKAFHLNTPLIKSFFNLLLYVATLLITIRYAIKKSKVRQGYFTRIDFNKIQGWLIPVVIAGSLAMIVLLDQSAAWIPMPKWVQKLFEAAFSKDVFSIVTMVIAAPIMEEIFCRVIILSGLLQNYSPYKAILISAIFFGALHLNPWQTIPATFGGLFLGWVYYKTKSVIPGIIIHATINITASLFLFLPGHQQDMLSLLGMPYYLLACVVSILIFVAVCIIINRKVVAIPESVF